MREGPCLPPLLSPPSYFSPLPRLSELVCPLRAPPKRAKGKAVRTDRRTSLAIEGRYLFHFGFPFLICDLRLCEYFVVCVTVDGLHEHVLA